MHDLAHIFWSTEERSRIWQGVATVPLKFFVGLVARDEKKPTLGIGLLNGQYMVEYFYDAPSFDRSIVAALVGMWILDTIDGNIVPETFSACYSVGRPGRSDDGDRSIRWLYRAYGFSKADRFDVRTFPDDWLTKLCFAALTCREKKYNAYIDIRTMRREFDEALNRPGVGRNIAAFFDTMQQQEIVQAGIDRIAEQPLGENESFERLCKKYGIEETLYGDFGDSGGGVKLIDSDCIDSEIVRAGLKSSNREGGVTIRCKYGAPTWVYDGAEILEYGGRLLFYIPKYGNSWILEQVSYEYGFLAVWLSSESGTNFCYSVTFDKFMAEYIFVGVRHCLPSGGVKDVKPREKGRAAAKELFRKIINAL